MKLIIDENYRIASDSMNYVLQERKISLDGKNKGEEYLINVGYYGKIYHALQAYKELQIRNSDVSTIEELITLIKDIDKNIEKFLGGN